MKDPLWKVTLCWASVLTFFLMPLTFFVVQMWAVTHPGWIDEVLATKYMEPHISYLQDLQRNVTIIVVSLAGLRTWQDIKNGRPAKPAPPLRPEEPRHTLD